MPFTQLICMGKKGSLDIFYSQRLANTASRLDVDKWLHPYKTVDYN